MAGELLETPQERATPANSPSYSRLTRSDITTLIKLNHDGLSQTEIAQRLGCTQSTVSKWLASFTDTADLSKEYLRAKAFRMAQNIVKNGLPRDHVNALKGIGVLEQDKGADIKLMVGIALPGMPEPQTPQAVVVGRYLPEVSEKSLAISHGSDNQSSVNQD